MKINTKLIKEATIKTLGYLTLLFIISFSLDFIILKYTVWNLQLSHKYLGVEAYAMTSVNVPHIVRAKDENPKEWILNEWAKVGQRDNAEKIINCESGFDNNRVNINTNKTADLSVYQWNTLHLKSGFITLKCLSDYKCSTYKAVELWRKSGFKPWVCARLLNIK
jgi:hypothetical protein